jgi:hypothetical protein
VPLQSLQAFAAARLLPIVTSSSAAAAVRYMLQVKHAGHQPLMGRVSWYVTKNLSHTLHLPDASNSVCSRPA